MGVDDLPKMSENDKMMTCWISVWLKEQSRNES